MRAAGLRRLVCLLVAASAAPAAAAPADDLRARIDPLANALIHEHQVVGMVVGIVKDGKT